MLFDQALCVALPEQMKRVCCWRLLLLYAALLFSAGFLHGTAGLVHAFDTCIVIA
jgi:hypothetical protein